MANNFVLFISYTLGNKFEKKNSGVDLYRKSAEAKRPFDRRFFLPGEVERWSEILIGTVAADQELRKREDQLIP